MLRRIPILLTAALAAAWLTAGARADVTFGEQPLDAWLATTLASAEGQDLLMWGECRNASDESADDCVMLVVSDGPGQGFSVLVIEAAACADDGAECYGGFEVLSGTHLEPGDREQLESLLDVHGGLGGTALGATQGPLDGDADIDLELRVRVHGGIATSPLGIVDDLDNAELPELRVKVYGGIATSPLGMVAGCEELVQVEGGLGSSPVGFIETPDPYVEVNNGLGSCPLGITPADVLISNVVAMLDALLD